VQRDVTIRLQEPDGTWQSLGTDRALGIVAEGLQLTSNSWGPDTASFELHREPNAQWPDLAAFTPVEIEVGNQLVWSGRVKESQIQDGDTRQLSVTCEGWQYHLDDDQFSKTYVNRNLADWRPISDYVTTGTSWSGHGGVVEANDAMISMAWPEGTSPPANSLLGITLDLGSEVSPGDLSLYALFETFDEYLRSSSTVDGTGGTGMLTSFELITGSGAVSTWGSLPKWLATGTYNNGDLVYYQVTHSGATPRWFVFRCNTNGVTGTANSPVGAPSKWDVYYSCLQLYAYASSTLDELQTLANRTGSDISTNDQVIWGHADPRLYDSSQDDGFDTGEYAYWVTSTNKRVLTNGATFVSGVSHSARYITLVLSLADNMTRKPETYGKPYTYGIELTGLTTYLSDAYSANSGLNKPTSRSSIRSASSSVFKASQAVVDAVQTGTTKLTANNVQSTSTSLQHFRTDGLKTPRELINQANAYHGWIARIDENRDVTFKPLPTTPVVEVGSWSGYELSDQAASSGEDIYSRVIVTAQGPNGRDLRVARSAGQIASSAQISTAGASTLTSDQRQSIQLVDVDDPAISPGTVSAKLTGYDIVTHAGIFREGVTYRLTGSVCAVTTYGVTAPQTVQITFGENGYVTGTVKTYSGPTATSSISGNTVTIGNLAYASGSVNTKVIFDLLWTPDYDQNSIVLFSQTSIGVDTILGYTAMVNVIANYGSGYIDNTNGLSDAKLTVRGATLAERQGICRTYQLSAPGLQTLDTLKAIGDAWLYQHLRAQFKGSITVKTPTSLRDYATGDSVHPSRLILQAGELIRLSDRIDPDTGQIGRDARIASVTYDHDSESVSVELDNRRDNLQNLLNRIGVV
jgi:hypothetical protein